MAYYIIYLLPKCLGAPIAEWLALSHVMSKVVSSQWYLEEDITTTAPVLRDVA